MQRKTKIHLSGTARDPTYLDDLIEGVNCVIGMPVAENNRHWFTRTAERNTDSGDDVNKLCVDVNDACT